jgi:predicted Zn-dependent protease with MMP-like domain
MKGKEVPCSATAEPNRPWYASPMKREPFLELVRQALDSLPKGFREQMENLVVVVEDVPPQGAEADDLMGVFEGVPRTEQSFFDTQAGPCRVVLFQKNIEGYAQELAKEVRRSVEEVIREEVRLTVLHEVGHYFGLGEDALEDV